jgi:hypothetical protein
MGTQNRAMQFIELPFVYWYIFHSLLFCSKIHH